MTIWPEMRTTVITNDERQYIWQLACSELLIDQVFAMTSLDVNDSSDAKLHIEPFDRVTLKYSSYSFGRIYTKMNRMKSC